MQNSSLSVASQEPVASSRILLSLWMATVFLSAVLLFFVQPMFTKMVLPLLGGSPSVWSTALVFFQATLLAGYLYAHLSATLLDPREQIVLHLSLLAAASFTLPIAVGSDISPSVEQPILWLLGFLALSVGLPFFTLSANAPLLQSWFARTSHPAAKDPYFLYAASNMGSMLALLGFPFIFERFLSIPAQSSLWTLGFLFLIMLIATCGIAIWRKDPLAASVPHLAELTRPTWRMRGRWIALAAVPSSLLVGVTAHLSMDVAAVPLLWVVPLALYLLTFALVFASKPVIPHHLVLKLFPAVAIALAGLFWLRLPLWFSVIAHLVGFFAMAMMCHGELARQRPEANRATEFYLFMSLGGVIGGALSALLAPLIFNSVLEYPLAIALACWLRPTRTTETRWQAYLLDIALPLLLFAATRPELFQLMPQAVRSGMVFVALCALAFFAFAARNRPLRFALFIAALLSFVPDRAISDMKPLLELRSFFGVHRVSSGQEGAVHILTHGTTIHGMQYTDPARRCEPMTYYTKDGPFSQALASRTGPLRRDRVGIIGLGAGGTSVYRKPGEDWTYYEIDPLVRHIATETPYFTFLSDCAPGARIELGDARLTLHAAPPRSFDVLVLDAFSSDAIPVHLLTREAMTLYLDKLRVGGIILLHVSNRYLDLAPVLARIAEDMQLEFRMQQYRMKALNVTYSDWVVLARSRDDLGVMAADARWQQSKVGVSAPLWTDSFSNILDVLKP